MYSNIQIYKIFYKSSYHQIVSFWKSKINVNNHWKIIPNGRKNIYLYITLLVEKETAIFCKKDKEKISIHITATLKQSTILMIANGAKKIWVNFELNREELICKVLLA